MPTTKMVARDAAFMVLHHLVRAPFDLGGPYWVVLGDAHPVVRWNEKHGQNEDAFALPWGWRKVLFKDIESRLLEWVWVEQFKCHTMEALIVW